MADRVAVLARGKVIAAGSLNEIRGLVSRKRITCATSLAAEQLAMWPGIETAIRDRDRMHITASDAEDVVRRLLAADSGLRELEVRSAGLAEAFTELTQEAA